MIPVKKIYAIIEYFNLYYHYSVNNDRIEVNLCPGWSAAYAEMGYLLIQTLLQEGVDINKINIESKMDQPYITISIK